LKTARSFKPDLVLVDLIMPHADGLEVAVQLEADWALHSVPIVFLSSLITADEAKDGRRVYGHRILPKPTTSSELIKLVEQSLPSWAEIC
jgi:DNA-binding response OmpR family regulator